MEKIDAVVKKETYRIGIFSVVFSLVMQGIFLLLGKWSFSVLWGNLLGLFAAVGNFFLMAYTVQLAVEKTPDEAKKTVRLSQQLRMIGLFFIALIAHLLPCFHLISVIIPFLFPRLAIVFWSLTNKGKE
ncbi:MAG: ATP synthase subunit I [Clostridia bacterium]|nr:ATP synthase subunit I [Clostridia bacterium]